MAPPLCRAGNRHRKVKEHVVPVVQEVDRCPQTTVTPPSTQWLELVPEESNAPSFLFWSPGQSQVQLLSSVSLSAHSQPWYRIHLPTLANLTNRQIFKGEGEGGKPRVGSEARCHVPLMGSKPGWLPCPQRALAQPCQALQLRKPGGNEADLGIQKNGITRSKVYLCGAGGAALLTQLPASVFSNPSVYHSNNGIL